MTVYFVGYVDEEGTERIVSAPYASRKDAEWYAAFMHETLGYRDCHVREADEPTGEVIRSEEIANAARLTC